jgi:hypothetical protein
MITIQSFDSEQGSMPANRGAIVAKLVIYFVAGMESALMLLRVVSW